MMLKIKSILFVTSLFVSQHTLSQNDETILRKRLERYDNYDAGLMTNDSLKKYSPDKYLIRILQRRRIEESEKFPNLSIKRSPDKKLSIYGYSYWTHGTSLQGFFYVAQWTKSDGTFGAISLYPYLDNAGLKDYFGFGRLIIKLPSPDGSLLYLLIGQSAPSFSSNSLAHQVIQINNDKLVLNYPAFFGKASLLSFYDIAQSYDSLCENSSPLLPDSLRDDPVPEYDQKNQLLIIGCMGDEDTLNQIPGSHFAKTLRRRYITFKWNGKEFSLK
jgi:hypothetical protein